MSTLDPNIGLCASSALASEAVERSSDNDCIGTGNFLNFAYTDYGGYFLDIVFIDYFLEHYPENIVTEYTCYWGRNAIIFNTEKNPDLISRFTSETENYILGFESVEDFYSEKEFEVFSEFVEWFIGYILAEFAFDREKVVRWLHDERYGYYATDTQGIDCNTSELIGDLLEAGLITKSNG